MASPVLDDPLPTRIQFEHFRGFLSADAVLEFNSTAHEFNSTALDVGIGFGEDGPSSNCICSLIFPRHRHRTGIRAPCEDL